MPGFTINQVSLSGNLTRDPELRTTGGGTAVCSLRIAVNERTKDGSSGEWVDRANYFDVTVWKGLGESVAKQLSKGDAIAVGGRLRWHEWETKGGDKRSTVDIVADSVVPIPRGGRSTSGGGNSGRQEQPVGATAASDVPFSGGGMPGAEDDIPFRWRQTEWDDRYHANR